MTTYLKGFLALLVSSFGLHCLEASAQLSLGTPSVTDVKSCDDFATAELHDPFDMNNTGDVNNYFPGIDIGGFASAAVAGGVFSGVTTNSGSAFYLWSPVPCGAQAVGGRWGQNLSLDTNKYKQLSISMFTDMVDPFGIRLIWDRGCNYANSRTITSATAIPTKPGWHTYTVDLSNIALDSGSTNSNPWNAGSITGFAVIPTTRTGATVHIDWIRLEDPNSCSSSSSTVSYNASTQGNNNRFSTWLDDDTNPFNGYIQQLSSSTGTGSGSVTIASPLGINPDSYNVIGLLDGDYATLERSDPWDFSSDSDVLALGGISGASYSGGALSGSIASSGQIFLRLTSGGLNASRYSRLSLKLTRSSTSQPIRVFYDTDVRRNIELTKASHDPDNNDVYEFDLSGATGWSGTVSNLIIGISDPGTFSLDFMAIRTQGYVTSLDTATLAASVVSAGAAYEVDHAPVLTFLTPSDKGGEALRPWNMNAGDLLVYSNLDDGPDAAHPGESLTTLLPDVRTVDGLRGDFFKGTNDAGIDDPVNYSTFPFGVTNPIQINTDDYRYLCFKLLIDRPFSLGEGSVGRVIWRNTDTAFRTGEDIPLIYDGWSGTQWYEYCLDMKNYFIDGTTAGDWNGIVDALRVDPHEFTGGTSYYFDYIKLRRAHRSTTGSFNIVYDLKDPDDNATVSLYYSVAPATSGGQLIVSGLPESQGSYTWNTSGVPNGTYYIYGVATDGVNTSRRLASGPVVVANVGSSASTPVLSVESPVTGATYCSTLQLKGYSLLTDRVEDVAGVEVLVDSQYITTIHPSLYSIGAKAAYPSADSSNSGFNTTIDFAGFSAGAHTVTLRAIGSDGGVNSQNFSVLKGSGGCASLISDPPPSGSAVPVDLGGGSNVSTKPTIGSIKFDAKGKFSFKIGSAGSVGCTLAVKTGKTSRTATLDSGTFTVRGSEPTAGVALKATKIMLNKSKLKNFYLQVTKNCAGTVMTSGAKKVTVKTSTGKKTHKDVAKLLKKRLAR